MISLRIPRGVILAIACLGLAAYLLAPTPARAESEPRDTDPKTAEGWDPSERDAAEKPLLDAKECPAWREGRILFFRTDSYPLRSFVDVGVEDLWEIYFYRGRLGATPWYRIEVGGYEGGDFLLVDQRTGLHLPVDADPVLSPDARRFAVGCFDLEAGFGPNRVSVWRIEEPLPVLEWRVEPQNWGPREVKWTAPDRLEIRAAGRHPKAFAPTEEREAAEAAGVDTSRYIRTIFEARLDPAKGTWRSDAEKFVKEYLPLERSELEPEDGSESVDEPAPSSGPEEEQE